MKKILILEPNLPTLGGGEKYLVYLCRFLEDYFKGNVSIDILLYNHNHFGDVYAEDYVTIDDLMERFQIKLNCTKIKKIKIIPAAGQLKRLLNMRKVEKAAEGYDLFINLMFMSIHKARAEKNIYINMFPPDRLGHNSNSRIKQKIAKYHNDAFCGSYDVFLSISQFSARWLEIYWGNEYQNSIIYPPVFTSSDAENRYDESRKENIIMSVGRFFPDTHSKKQLEMVEMFLKNENKLGDFEYHLAGAVTDIESHLDYVRQVKKLAKKSKRIFIHENCSYDVLTDLYSKAKIFWHATGYGVDEEKKPKSAEHFGITTVEAMSYGAVPVVINKGGQPEIIKEDTSGYLWDTREECIDKTSALINDDDKRTQMARNAVQEAKHFSVETFYEKYAEVLDALEV